MSRLTHKVTISVCHAFLSVHCSLVVTCWERAYRLALLYGMFSCVFITFPCVVLGQVWYLIVSIPGLLTCSHFNQSKPYLWIYVYFVLGWCMSRNVCKMKCLVSYEPRHKISNNVVCATSKGSDQPAHTPSLIRAFASRLNILWILSYWPNIIWSF